MDACNHQTLSSWPLRFVVALGLWSVLGLASCGDDPPGGSRRDAAVADADLAGDADAFGGDADADADGIDVDADARVADGSVGDGDASSHDGASALDGSTLDANIHNPDNDRLDTDCDGISDADEFSTIYPGGHKTDPGVADSDGDGLVDGLEIGVTGAVPGTGCAAVVDLDPTTTTSPVDADSDGDGILDGAEDLNHDGRVDATESDPELRDTDGDGLLDSIEDRDRDGVRDPDELDPTKLDTDGDLIFDGVEDTNGDGLYQPGGVETDPLAVDTDGDTLADGEEDTNHNGIREPYETDPREPDTDCDGISDAAELQMGTSPLRADTDGDGLTDGVELGVTSPVPGTRCTNVPIDLDPATTTDPKDPDSDDDGVLDGAEDANGNGRVDASESNPKQEDSDGDGISDGDEVLAGTNPTDGDDPPAGSGLGVGFRAICADDALKNVDFNVQSAWTLVTEPGAYQYVAASVTSPGSNVDVGAFNSGTAHDEVAGFVVRRPVASGSALTASEQALAVFDAIRANAASFGVQISPRLTPRSVTSHDGFASAVSGIADITADTARSVGYLRRQLLYRVTELSSTAFSGLPSDVGAQNTQFVYQYQVLIRAAPEPQELIVVGALAPKSVYDDGTRLSAIRMADLTNGTALALANAPHGKDCDPFVAAGQSAADFIWMSDVSGSTTDDRGRISGAAQQVVNALTVNGVDFRMGVVLNSSSDHRYGAGLGGALRGAGFVRDPSTFASYLSALGYCDADLSRPCDDDSDCQSDHTECLTDSCEFGLEAASDAIREALPRSAAGVENARKLRADATLAVVYVSDEFAQELTMADGVCAGDASIACSSNNGCPSNARPCLRGERCSTRKYSASSQTYDVRDLYGCDTAVRSLYQPGGVRIDQVCAAPVDAAARQCIDTIVAPFADQIRAEDGIAFAQILLPNATPTLCSGYGCGGPNDQEVNEPGRGYAEVVAATGGVTYSPCNNDPGTALEAIVDAVSGLSSQYRLNADPISATLKVGIVDTTQNPPVVNIVPRSQSAGFDYDSVSNSIFFRGAAHRPREGDLVVVSYRVWTPPTSACGTTPCAAGQNCDPDLGVCVCDPVLCQQCGTNEVCTADCGCACGPNCNGQCGPGQVCDSSSCTCECAPDCGGACGAGTTCNPTTCQCECDADCGGACDGSLLECNATSTCACECPEDCGGACANGACNMSLCACDCGADCDASCPGNARCDLANGCACECPADCGGCSDNTVCNETTCTCECDPVCQASCRNLEVCDPSNNCQCACPEDCGGCGPAADCNPVSCTCIPRV